MGKNGDHTKVQRPGLPEAPFAAIRPDGDALSCGHLPLGGCPVSTIAFALKERVWSHGRFWFAITPAQACSRSSRICFPANSTVCGLVALCLPLGLPCTGWGGAVLAVRSFWKPFLLWQFKFMWFLIVCKQSLLNPAPSLHPRSAGIQRWLLI